MAENKKNYWLKLKNDFFQNARIKKLRKIAGGNTYTIIYLKLQLLSLENEGKLYFEGIEPSFEEEIALKLDEELDDVKITIQYLLSSNLMEMHDEEYVLPETIECIGSETASTIRSRKSRLNKKMLQSNNNATNCNIEIDIENRDREKRKEIDIDIYSRIIDYLNLHASTSYKATTPKTQTLIKARLNEKFTEEDFYKVIDNKCTTWLNTDMSKYLRPETLFGTKFESYLNENVKNNKFEDNLSPEMRKWLEND